MFPNRRQAGITLAGLVRSEAPDSPIVYALPRGGVPVGFEVARALECPFDVLLVRKVGMPGHEELAIGAVAEGGITIDNEEVIAMAGVRPGEVSAARMVALDELARRVALYRKTVPAITPTSDTTAIIVDDGLATGSTARAAIEATRERGPGAVWLAVPVAPRDTVAELGRIVEKVIVVQQPRYFGAVGAWYRDFTQTSDDEVRSLLAASRDR
jgi:predicted phosphoribosyltransferase